MMEKVQRFGSAMLAPVLLFAFAGLAVGIAIIAQNGELIPLAADKESAWNHFWSVWESGAWTVFNQMELLFVIGLPIALAKTANARAVMEAAMVYLTSTTSSAPCSRYGARAGSRVSFRPGLQHRHL